MIDHITEAKNPTIGKAINAIDFEPKSANVKLIIAANVKPIITFRLSINFKRTNPKAVPATINPQNNATVFAPIVCGSTA